MNYEFTLPSLKQIKKLPKSTAQRIIHKLDYFISQKEPLSFADRITDTRIGTYRFRAGDYRIICDVDGDILVILKIGHRRDIYKQ